jgi:two-component system chemotaxis response regulator CheB
MSIVPAAATSSAPRTEQPLRVMVVDDAIVVRSLLARWIDGEPDMEVVA